MNAQKTTIELPTIKKFKSGKVRDIFEVGDKLLLVASDRISAFDVIMDDPIPDKGKVLTAISLFWFDHIADIVKNHLITADVDQFPEELKQYRDQLEGRSMLVTKADVVPIECVVRGYLAGSGWKEYQASQTVCGHSLPEGLLQADKLPEPIFTPATKAESGHDENISIAQMKDKIGSELADKMINASKNIYTKCSEYATLRGMILADTKFEFGIVDGELILVDEVLTPDSSRFWPVDSYKPGSSPASYDKQFLRDYLDGLDWPKSPPPPPLPEEIVNKTREKYVEAYKKLTGKTFASG
jgi:phosphoribosylaminoimidazole-succinocarboxamide synthase